MLASGVYIIINTISGVAYIGSSVKIKTRLKEHHKQLKENRHHNSHLQSSYNFYGPEAFVYELLEATPYEDRLEAEQFWIDNLKTLGCKLYNFRPVLETPGKLHSEETKASLRLLHTGRKMSEETKIKISKASKGRVISEEQKLKLIEFHTGRKRSKETKAKMREPKLGKKASETTKEKMRNRVMSDETRTKLKNRICSEVTRAKCRASQKIRREREASQNV